jgi:hypothetical protein
MRAPTLAQQPPAQLAQVTVGAIIKNDGPRIGEGFLRRGEIHAMARRVRALLGGIPDKAHCRTLGQYI